MQSTDPSTVARAATQRPWALSTAAALIALSALVFFLLAPGASGAPRASGPLVSTAATGLGQILVDSRGHTLYLFEKDKNAKSACTTSCAAAWPPLIATTKARAAAGAKAALLGTTKRADGRMQVTYNRHPLYTFVKDTKKGQTSGENLDAFGAEWYAVSTAGAKVEPKSAATTTPPASSGGYGYGG
jgi:predicted lipoprotein with Yx(FWY)xxD motif